MGICASLRQQEEVSKKENKIAKALKISKCSSFTPVTLKAPQQEPATASKRAMKLTKARAMRVISWHFMTLPLEDDRGEAGQIALDTKGCFVHAVIIHIYMLYIVVLWLVAANCSCLKPQSIIKPLCILSQMTHYTVRSPKLARNGS